MSCVEHDYRIGLKRYKPGGSLKVVALCGECEYEEVLGRPRSKLARLVNRFFRWLAE